MSPYPQQVNQAQIIEKAIEMIEREGAEAVSMNKLAAELGIRAPSLYRHIENRAALLRAVNTYTTYELVNALELAVRGFEGVPRILQMAAAYRNFALKNPQIYALAFLNMSDDLRPDGDELEALVLPLQSYMAHVVGEAASLTALRGFMALVHGFVLLEMREQLRRGGDLNVVFEQSIDAYMRGWLVKTEK